MEETFPDDLDEIPLDVRRGAVCWFLNKLMKDTPDNERGAENMLARLQDVNLSGFGYVDEGE